MKEIQEMIDKLLAEAAEAHEAEQKATDPDESYRLYRKAERRLFCVKQLYLLLHDMQPNSNPAATIAKDVF